MKDLFHRTAHDPTLPAMASLLLRYIGKHPGVSVSELARRAHTAKSYVSHLVYQLVDKGLVEKRSDAQDQRIVCLYPTEAMAHKLAEAEVRLQRAWQKVLDNIPEEERDDVGRVLHTLLKACRGANQYENPPDDVQESGEQ